MLEKTNLSIEPPCSVQGTNMLPALLRGISVACFDFFIIFFFFTVENCNGANEPTADFSELIKRAASL